MSNETETPSATVKVGGRSLAPSFTARGDVDTIRAQVAAAFGIEMADTLAETLVVAQLKADEIFAKHLQAGTGAEVEDLPKTEAKSAPKRSGRGKAKAEPKTPADPVSESMLAAESLERLREVWTQAKAAGRLDKAVHEPLFKKIATERKWV